MTFVQNITDVDDNKYIDFVCSWGPMILGHAHERVTEAVKKAAEDTFKLYDNDTNLESNDYTENIGEEIFKINKEAFERSTYIPQGQIKTEMNDSINAKLGNVLESGNDINNSEEAIKKITDAMKIYIKTGNKGIINEKKQKIHELERDLTHCKIDEQNLYILKNKLEECKQKQKEKQALLDKKIEVERQLAKQETYNNIKNQLEELNEKYNKLNNFFYDEIPNDATIAIVFKSTLKLFFVKCTVLNFLKYITLIKNVTN